MKNEVISIVTTIPKQTIIEIKEHFEGLDDLSDELVYQTIIGYLLDQYLTPDELTQTDIDEMFEFCSMCHKHEDPDGNCGCTNPDSLG